jgi:nuclear RNA export factor
MLAAIDSIAKKVPDLAALDLSDNNLQSLDSLSVLSIKLPNLKVLNIGRNKIFWMHHLDCLLGLRLEHLVLDGNPLCMKYKYDCNT